jgi:hypothetical protein
MDASEAEPPDNSKPARTDQREKRLLHAASRRISGLRCVLDRIEDRGNRAAALRTCEALGILHVHEVAPKEPERGRSRGVAGGGEKWLMMHMHADAAECRAALAGFDVLAALPPVQEVPASASWQGLGGKRRRRQKRQRQQDQAAPESSATVPDVSESASGSSATVTAPPQPPSSPPPELPEPTALESLDFGRPTALVFGNERLGVSAEMLKVCDGAFHIPLHGLTESLNVSVACAISLHYGRLARVAALRSKGDDAGGLNADGGDLSQVELEALLAEYETRGPQYAKAPKPSPKGLDDREGVDEATVTEPSAELLDAKRPRIAM